MPPNKFSVTGNIAKLDDDQRLVFGWANVACKADGSVIEDSQGETISPAELEKAAYTFVINMRQGGVMHERIATNEMVESCVFTKEKQAAIGIPPGTVPEGWWVGFRFGEEEFAKVKSGHYAMFSIHGTAMVDDE